ncbi:MAG: hypothetical protein WDA16_13065 [Candidatus Thermoplasmatota archaeon]
MSSELTGAPSLPAPSIRTRIAELGYGSGPWSRLDLVERWGAATANKLIAEAKDGGWLVAPFRDQYFVPAAADLMVVSWLPPAQRREFVISRTLAASRLRFWSLSAWASTEGLLFSEPLFVTDLSLADPAPTSTALEPGRPAEAMAEQSRKRAQAIRSVPFIENVIIVPILGRLGDRWERSRVKLPEPKRPRASRSASPGGLGVADPKTPPNVIEYQVTRRMDDAAWLFGFLSALNIPRVREPLRRLAEEEVRASSTAASRSPKARDIMDRAMRWGASFGPPSPNENWQDVLASGTFPYLLVPKAIWNESLSFAASRVFDDLTKLRRSLDA